ncbi:hypothetical protein [Qipengyuania sphaerica]|uniref:hypothetical protein n=1 Tax=Qipengyuania sphaerica TaxID=2867243 RepID=UPI001C86F2B8|nr:hypothetical protein [Qipengyuania sphaerica]MBX7541259.1 hypothetical protein [Qipengyuania sphaerica]
MATLHQSVSAPPVGTGFTAFVDRWIYVFTAALFFVVVLVGFIPDSMMKIAMVQKGAAPPFPLAMHAHAVLMGAWISLLLVQSVLMATGRRNWHMQLGVAGLFLMPAILVAGFALIPTRRAQYAEMIAGAPADVALRLQTEVVPFVNNIMIMQFRAGIMFAILAGLALWFRKRDSGMHKRLMFLATLVPMPAAIDRMQFIPHTMPASPLSAELYPLLLIAPMFAWDLYRLGKVHRAYLIWGALALTAAVITHFLWDNQAWYDLVGPIGGLGSGVTG